MMDGSVTVEDRWRSLKILLPISEKSAYSQLFEDR